MLLIICIIFFLLITIINVLILKKYICLVKQITYISKKIEVIIENETRELILIPTDNKTVKSLTISINKLLEYSHKKKLSYENSKLSMMRMLSNISHDLKTPLTTLKGYIEILGIKFNNNALIVKIELRINEIIDLISKFFDLVKLESGDKILNLIEINICEVCRKNMFEFYDILVEKKIITNIQIPEKPIYINAEEDSLNRILKNIINNAINYGIDGKYLGINIKENLENICIIIEDHGKGILEKHKEEIFERMYTLEDSRSRIYQGSGLGLTISKELVEHMGGKIELESIPNKKTQFKVLFPKKQKKFTIK